MPYTSDQLPYSNHTTSREAAESQAPHAPTDESRILNVLRVSTSTCDALERCLGLSHQTCSARIRGLVKKGKIRPSCHSDGTHRYHPTASGRRAIVWELAFGSTVTTDPLFSGHLG